MSDMEEIVYLNGSLVPRSQARVSVFDHGLLYGYGLFETMRACNGRIFMLECHLARLRKSAETIGLPSLASVDLARACEDTLSANQLESARLRLTVTRGEVDAFPGKRGVGCTTVLVTAKSYTPLPPEVYGRGYRAGIASYRQNSQSLAGVKSTSYLMYVLARMEAQGVGLDEAILLNERGAIAEGSTSNIFFVSRAKLLTPSLGSGILPGVTRQVVFELAQAEGTPAEEAEIKPEDLTSFDEAFLTNSVIGVMPLVQVSYGRKAIAIGSGKPGVITQRLMAAYDRLVQSQIA